MRGGRRFRYAVSGGYTDETNSHSLDSKSAELNIINTINHGGWFFDNEAVIVISFGGKMVMVHMAAAGGSQQDYTGAIDCELSNIGNIPWPSDRFYAGPSLYRL